MNTFRHTPSSLLTFDFIDIYQKQLRTNEYAMMYHSLLLYLDLPMQKVIAMPMHRSDEAFLDGRVHIQMLVGGSCSLWEGLAVKALGWW